MRTRVLHIVPALYDGSGRIAGGAERYAYELARVMAERVPTRLVSFGPEDHRSAHGPLSVRIIRSRHNVGGQTHNPWSREILREALAADVVHCHQRDIVVSKVMTAVSRMNRRRVFVTDHGGGIWDWTSRLGWRPSFDGYLHVSGFSRRLAGQTDDPRAEVVYAGVHLTRFSPPSGDRPRRRVLFVGRLVPHKGVDVLIEALPQGLGLDVAGSVLDQRYGRDLEALARGRDVLFHRDWDDERLRDAYRDAMCVVLPSVYEDRYGRRAEAPELLGQTLLEGMACGAPAIGTDVGGMPEVVAHLQTGYIVPPGDRCALKARLTELFEDEHLTRSMGRAASEHVRERFTWDAVVDRCLRAYTRQASEDGSTRRRSRVR